VNGKLYVYAAARLLDRVWWTPAIELRQLRFQEPVPLFVLAAITIGQCARWKRERSGSD
jgi:hypothetical protein